MKTFIDVTGRVVTLEKTPKRIISLVPSQTELLYDLNLEDRIVGITKFCVHPVHFRSTKKIVGGTKTVHFDKIKELNPDFILCNKEENTKEMVVELEKIAPTYVTNIQTISDSLKSISILGDIFGKRTEATLLVSKINFCLDDFKTFIKNYPIKNAAYFIWANPWMAAGNNTFINELLKLNNFENIYANRAGYPEVEIEKIRQEGDPEYVLLSSEPFPFKDEHAFELGRSTHHGITLFVDGEYFSWFGSRLIKAFDYFKQLQLRINK
jgi:ABC-type Fe3+-hydroxamate transport system substrate-binding protein